MMVATLHHRLKGNVSPMKIRKVIASLLIGYCFVLLLTSWSASSAYTMESKEPSPPNVRYTFLSLRWLTKDELKQFDDVFGLALAVRMRLSNEGKNPVYYLADSNGSIRPHGYQFFRKLGASTWEFLPPSRGREGVPGSEFTGTRYTYLMLPPNAAVEFEMLDWSNPEQEHAFTTFIKVDADAKPMEITSETFRPTATK
jgi:hypothetical protein